MTSKNLTDSTDLLSIKTVSTISSISSRLYWRRRQNCCTNFYAILWTIFRRNERKNKRRNQNSKVKLTQSVGGDFVYTNAYEVLLPTPRHSPNSVDKMSNDKLSNDLYFLRSESLNLSPPPPLPQRNLSQSPDSISPQPRPDIGLASPSPPPCSQGDTGSVLSKKFRKTVFTNSHFEPLLEEDDDIFGSKKPSVNEKDDEEDFKGVDFNHLLVGIKSGNADSLWTQVIAEPRKSFGHKEKLKTKQNSTFNQVKLSKKK